MSLVEVDEAVSVIHEASGEEANVIMGAVIDENMGDDMMVTVIATGFNKKGLGAIRVAKQAAKIERIPVGVNEIKSYDEPAYIRKGIDISINQPRTEAAQNPGTTNRPEEEKPAFLRKIMD